ncbi:MAG: 4-(cytidine 5'-diphospho)-2-C-methyl-D-erythritol kinase, partial [Spirochaetales bacterium]|nr:4-(cytidine 5'-diphospho)-2-C-methyl-D-erythritol kinase [Spirochaetales bacterium]
MNECFVMKAPAKINLHLQVGNKREDGFHDIMSLFQMVDLYDEMRLSSLKTDNDCRIIGNFNCRVEDNLIYKAWQYYCKACEQKIGVIFEVEKIIPSFAGMGGGSSDAATALIALNKMFGLLTDKDLIRVAAKVGSDVPFFLSTTTAAIISGKGENVSSIKKPEKLPIVLVNPEIKISTPEAYKWIDESREDNVVLSTENELLEIYYGEKNGYKSFYNDFTPVLEKRNNIFSVIKNNLYETGALYSNVTGSGSTVFGIYSNEKDAEKAVNVLSKEINYVQKNNLLDISPNAILE